MSMENEIRTLDLFKPELLITTSEGCELLPT